MCSDGNSTGEVIFLARMISFDGMNSTALLSQLQQWVQSRPTITVSGVPMTVSSDCSVSLGELSKPMCIPITIPSSPEPTTPRTNTANHDESSPTNLQGIPITAGLVGGMFFYIVIIMLVAIVLICKRRKRNHQRNRYDTLIQPHLNGVFDFLCLYHTAITALPQCMRQVGRTSSQTGLQNPS